MAVTTLELDDKADIATGGTLQRVVSVPADSSDIAEAILKSLGIVKSDTIAVQDDTDEEVTVPQVLSTVRTRLTIFRTVET